MGAITRADRQLASLAEIKAVELNLSYSGAASYVLRCNPALARDYRRYTMMETAQPPEAGPAQIIDYHLSNTASNYRPAGFIADRILPIVLRRSLPYQRYALKADVTLEDRANADPLFVQQFEEGRVHRVMDALFLDWEIRSARLVMNESNVMAAAPPDRPWTDYANADPLDDVLGVAGVMEKYTQIRPNRTLFSGTAWRHFRRNQKVIEKATNPHVGGGGLYPSVRQVEALLGMEVLVGNAWHNAAEESMPLNLTQIWRDDVLVYCTPDRPGIGTPSFGYVFRPPTPLPEIPDVQVERLPYDSRHHRDGVEVSFRQAEIITVKELGCLIRNVTEHRP